MDMASIIKNNVYNELQKKHAVRESFNSLNDKSPVARIKFYNEYRRLPKDQMLENMDCLVKEGCTKTSISFFNLLLETNNFSDSELEGFKTIIENTIANSSEYTDTLQESVNLIDKLLIKYNSYEYMRENAFMALYRDRIERHYLYEAYLDNELEIIMYNINYSPETISDFEALIRKIKTAKTPQYLGCFPKLLEKSTDMIEVLSINLTGDVLLLITSIPEVIADELIKYNISKSQLTTYKKIYNVQIARVSKLLKGNGRPELYNLYTAYMRVLVRAIEKLDAYSKTNSLSESISEMQPDIISSEAVIDDLTGELEETIANLVFDENEDEFDETTLENFVRLCTMYEKLTEGKITQKATKVADKVGDKTRKIGFKAQASARDSKRLSTSVTKSVEPLTNLFNNTINKIKEDERKDRTEKIVTGNYHFKLSSLLRKTIITLGTYAAGTGAVGVAKKAVVFGIKGLTHLKHPVLLAIGLLTARAVDKKLERKERKKILTELEMELKMTREKIEDAKSDGNKEAKYELMRIENKLEKDIERIKFGLKD